MSYKQWNNAFVNYFFKENKDEETMALHNYNKKVLSDKRVETVLLPVRDGLNISRKLSNSTNRIQT
mgnify:CR=1 FL=1